MGDSWEYALGGGFGAVVCGLTFVLLKQMAVPDFIIAVSFLVGGGICIFFGYMNHKIREDARELLLKSPYADDKEDVNHD